MKLPRLLCALLLGACLATAPAKADEAAEKGRAVFAKYKSAVVTVRVVVSISAGGNADDNEGWANGAIVDPSGLTVVALSFIDPTGIYAKMAEPGGDQPNVKVTLLRMILEDGTDIPAEVILRDNDLDLAFIRPTEAPKTPFPNIDLNNAAEPALLENVLVISQLGEVARRAHSAALERIETVIEKPRSYYLLGEHRASAVLSAPVFSLEGQFIGIGAMRAIAGAGGGGLGDNVLVVIVPAKDVKESAAQVPAAPAKG